MTTPTDSRFSVAGLVAVLAGVAGVVLLVMAVVRFVGTLGGSTEQTAQSLPTTEEAGVAPTSTTRPSATIDPNSWVAVADDSGSISVEVPAEWGDVSGSGWVIDGQQLGPAIVAASDVDAWYSSWGTPGAFVGVSTTGIAPDIGDFSEICTVGKTDERSAGVLSGTVQSWSRCGDEGSDFYVFVGSPTDASYSVLVQLVSIDGMGLDTLEQLMATFSYAP